MLLYAYWFLLALILVGLEIVTGTFYLLILAIAMAIGGIAARLDLAFTAQLVLAALASLVGILSLRYRKGVPVPDTTQNLDTGQSVKILTWNADGTARVFYRGAEWNAVLEAQDGEHEGVFYIKEMRGSVLILTNRKTV